MNFNIDDVVSLNFDDKARRWKGSSQNDYYLTCPFCKGKAKLNINRVKGMWRCAKCDEHGNALTLHAKLNGISNKDAYKDLSQSDKIGKTTVQAEEEDVTLPLADLYIRDSYYRSLLRQTVLSDKHRECLHKRGLTDEQIAKLGYKTYPVCGLNTIAKNAFGDAMSDNFETKHLHADDFTGEKVVPGFYDCLCGEAMKLVRKKNGFLIPVKTFDGKISGFQIRNDDLGPLSSQEDKENFHKYTWLSSSSKITGRSVTGCENIHYVGFNGKFPKNVYLTEGCLKADIASTLSNKPFIAIMGVNNVSQLPKNLYFLKENGVETINICLDMDYLEKKEVAKALRNIQNIIESIGLKYHNIHWDPQYKGIDDYLVAKKQMNKLKLEKAV